MNNFISITKLPDVHWVEHISPIREFIKTYLESEKEIISANKNLTEELKVPVISLIEIEVRTFEGNNVPDDLKNIPAVKPGSRFLKK